jgi:hypothetical protein
MNDWPEQIDYKDIMIVYNNFIRIEYDKPFINIIDYMNRNNLCWDDIAPSPPFNQAVVWLWRNGRRKPNLSHIDRIIRRNGIPETEVVIPSDRDAQLAAEVGTLKYIEKKWFSMGGGPAKAIDVHQIEVLEFFVRKISTLRNPSQLNTFLADIAGEIRGRFPASDIRTVDDLKVLLADWLKPHAAFYDALIEEDKLDEFQQITAL